MAIKLSIVSNFESKGTKQANAALKEFQKEFKLTEAEMDGGIGTLAKQSVQWEQLGTKVSAFGNNVTSVGKSVTMGLTVPVVAAGAAVVKAASDMESAFANVKKTVNASDEEYQELYDDAVAMSKVHPIDAADVAILESLGAQLGIATNNLSDFAEVAYGLDIATDMEAETAATQLAQFANITGLAQTKLSNLGSTVVALGNTSATTESTIFDMAMRIAAAGTQAGMSEANVMAISAALASVGLEAEAGGTAMSNTMNQITKDVALNSKNVETWAQLAGMSVDRFKTAWQSGGDITTQTFADIVQGMASTSEESGALVVLMDQLGITGIRQSDAMTRLAGSGDLLTRSISTANTAFEENTALGNEVANFEDTLANKWEVTKNKVEAAAITMGGPMLDSLSDVIDQGEPLIGWLTDAAEAFADMSEEQQKSTLGWIAGAAAIGPAVTILGKATTGIGSVITAGGKLKGWMAKLDAQATTGTLKNKAYAASVKGIGTAAGIAGAAIGTALVAKMAVSAIQMTSLGDSINVASKNFENAIENTKSFGDALANASARTLDTDTALSAYGTSIGELDGIVSSAQSNITSILAASLSEQRQLRDDEIASIYDYNAQIAEALGAKTDTYIASLGTEYDMVTAEEGRLTTEEATTYLASIDAKQSEATDIAREAYEKQLTELTRFHEAEGTINSDEYADQKKALAETYDEKLGEIENYADRAKKATATSVESMTKTEKDAWSEMSNATADYSYTSMGWLDKVAVNLAEFVGTNQWTEANYKEALADMDLSTASAFLAMQTTIVDSGGKITEENMALAEAILSAFDDMPPGMNEVAKDALIAMTDGMESQWPWLANVANMTADQIVDNIRLELSGAYSEGSAAGWNLGAGFAGGMDSYLGTFAIQTAAGKLGKSALASLQGSLEEHSPSKAAQRMGAYIPEGLAIGIDDGADAASDAAGNLGIATLDALSASTDSGMSMDAAFNLNGSGNSYDLGGNVTYVYNLSGVSINASSLADVQTVEELFAQLQKKSDRNNVRLERMWG